MNQKRELRQIKKGMMKRKRGDWGRGDVDRAEGRKGGGTEWIKGDGEDRQTHAINYT